MVGSIRHFHHYRVRTHDYWRRSPDFVHSRSTRLANVRLHHCRWLWSWNVTSKRILVCPGRPPTILPPHRKRNNHVLTDSIVSLPPSTTPPQLKLTLAYSGAIFLAISNAVLSNGLVNEISSRIPGIDPNTIISAGATGIRNIVTAEQLPLVLAAYNSAVRNVFIMSIATGGCAFLASLGFEWKSIKGKNLAAGLA